LEVPVAAVFLTIGLAVFVVIFLFRKRSKDNTK
jgi:hypothetical protein